MASEQQPAASWGADTDGRLNQPSEHLTHHAMWQTDASGNVTGLVGQDGLRPKLLGSGILTKSAFGKLGVTDATTYAFTSHHQMVLAAPFYAVKIGIQNAHTAEVTGIKAAVAVTNTWGADGSTTTRDPSTATWVNATFGGAATATIAAGTADRPTIVWSDWIELASIDRTDGGSLPILMLRVMSPTSDSHNYYSNINTGDWSGWRTEANIANGRAYRAINQATDGVTTPANFTQTTVTTTPINAIVQYVTLSRGKTIMGIGDSIIEGAGGTVRNYGDIPRYAFGKSTPQNPIEFCNLGWAGQDTGKYYLRALDMIDDIKPDFLVYSPFSPNDGSTVTAAIISAQKTRLARVLQTSHDNGVAVVVANGMPSTPGGAAGIDFGSSDALRVAFNAVIATMGGYVLYDRAGVVSGSKDGDGQVNYNATYTTDNLHPNEAGWVALSGALTALLG